MLLWGAAGRPLPGQADSGDRHVVQPFEDGVLVAVIDAVGHGAEAARVAALAALALGQRPGDPVHVLLRRCHERLRGSRGAAISVASFDRRGRTMIWLGIGNVCGVMLRPGEEPKPLLVRSGLIGDRLPDLEFSGVPVEDGDTLIMATDGIDTRFSASMDDAPDPHELAKRIHCGYAKSSDDSLVLVARYDGAG
jgi:hypothetical protein